MKILRVCVLCMLMCILPCGQAEAAIAKAAELQTELGEAYKSKSQISEDLLKVRGSSGV